MEDNFFVTLREQKDNSSSKTTEFLKIQKENVKVKNGEFFLQQRAP